MVFSISDKVAITETPHDYSNKVWKQLFISFIASLPFFTHGVQTIALSSSIHSGHFIVTNNDIFWSTTALILANIASAPVYCYLVDNYGRRIGIFGINLMQAASCIPLFLPQTEASTIIFHVFAGLASGGLFTILPIYVREISDDSIRGVTTSLLLVFTTAGHLAYLALDLETIEYVIVAAVALQFISMFLMMETPSYLMMKGKTEEAKTNEAKLRCVPESAPSVGKHLSQIEAEITRAKSIGQLSLWNILKNQLFRDVTKIGMVLHTTMVLSGSILFLDQDKTLMQLQTVIDPERFMILSCLFGGSLLTFTVIRFLSRRIILMSAYIPMMLCMGLLAVFTQPELTLTSSRWVPVAALGVIVFGYGMAWGLPVVVMVEALNIEIRTKVIGFLFVYSQLLKLLHIHTFKYVEEHVGIHALCIVFAIINMFGAVYVLFMLPEIRGKTTAQIEKQLKRIPLITFKTVEQKV